MGLTLFTLLTGLLRSILQLAGILVDFATFCNLIQQEASAALKQPGAQLVRGFSQEVDETDSLFHEALPVRVFHHHTWSENQQMQSEETKSGEGREEQTFFAFTFSNGLREAGEELMLLGQSEWSAF